MRRTFRPNDDTDGRYDPKRYQLTGTVTPNSETNPVATLVIDFFLDPTDGFKITGYALNSDDPDKALPDQLATPLTAATLRKVVRHYLRRLDAFREKAHRKNAKGRGRGRPALPPDEMAQRAEAVITAYRDVATSNNQRRAMARNGKKMAGAARTVAEVLRNTWATWGDEDSDPVEATDAAVYARIKRLKGHGWLNKGTINPDASDPTARIDFGPTYDNYLREGMDDGES